jgi:hypothetical protein
MAVDPELPDAEVVQMISRIERRIDGRTQILNNASDEEDEPAQFDMTWQPE